MSPIPSNVVSTLWNFKQRVPKEIIRKNLLFGENSSTAEVLKRMVFYNVSSSEIKARTMFITFGHNCCAYSKQRALHKAKTVGGFEYVHSYDQFKNLSVEKLVSDQWLFKLSSETRSDDCDTDITKFDELLVVWKPP